MKISSLLALLLAAATPATAMLGADEDAAQLRLLNAQDARVLRVGYRIAAANAELCPHKARLSGFLIHDALQYSPDLRPTAIRLFGFARGPSVAAVAPDSPAASAGLAVGDVLVAINQAPVGPGTPIADAPASYANVDALNRSVAAALGRGPMTLEVMRGGERRVVSLTPAIGCASLVQLVPSGGRLDAGADGDVVTISSGLADFSESDDEIAVHIGHEMAHNALGHRQRLRAEGVPERGLLTQIGRNAARIRITEREADYVGTYFLVRAGYDPSAAIAFWTRYGKSHSLGVFAAPTHPGWKRRVELVRTVMIEIAQLRAAGQPLLPGRLPAERD